MVHPVDAVLRNYVTPVTKAAGFRKRGRKYRLAGDNGDLVILEFDAMSDPGVFAVDFVMVPLSYWDWVTRNELDPPVPDVEGAVVRYDFTPPVEVAHRFRAGPPFSWRWVIDPADEGARCGTLLASTLSARLPLMRRLLDRETVLQEACDPASGVGRLRSRELLTLFLRIDAVDLGGLEELLSDLDSTQPNREGIAEWARRRVAARLAS
jgi:hypothetical protein